MIEKESKKVTIIKKIATKVKEIFKNKRLRLIIPMFAAVIILIAVFLMFTFKVGIFAKEVAKLNTTTVKKGNISISVTGSGSIASTNTNKISPKTPGTITKVYFKQGDTVKAGDLMYELDETDARLNVANTQNSIAQMQLTQNQNISSVSKLNFPAPYSGQVSNIVVKVGDVLQKNAPMFTLTDYSKLMLVVPFGGSHIDEISTGQEVTIYLQEMMQSVKGTISNISSGAYSNASGGRIYSVQIMIDNPGSLREGMKGNAEIKTKTGTISSIDNGTLSFINNKVIKSDSGGTVKEIRAFDNQKVNAGDILIIFENDDLLMSTATNDLKIQNLNTQLQINDNKLSYYKILAPADGTIVSQDKTIVAGYEVKQGEVLSTIIDEAHMEFVIPVDELDIAKIEKGQKASVTIDALPETTEKPLAAEVSDVAPMGTSSNGVTTYNVTVSITDINPKIRGGMNANANIIVLEKNDILLVPIEAVKKSPNGQIVMLLSNGNNKGNKQQGQGNTGTQNPVAAGKTDNANAARPANGTNSASATKPSNTTGPTSGTKSSNTQGSNSTVNGVPTPVQVGVKDASNIEIVSGLKEGDILVLPSVSKGNSTNATAPGIGIPGMGPPPGGPPPGMSGPPR